MVLGKNTNQWELLESHEDNFKSETIIHGNDAWKLFSRSIQNNNINGAVEKMGDKALGEKILDMVSVMA